MTQIIDHDSHRNGTVYKDSMSFIVNTTLIIRVGDVINFMSGEVGRLEGCD